MKAYFAIGDVSTAIRMLAGHRALVSFAYVGTRFVPAAQLPALAAATAGMMIDSGAFTAWRKGTSIDMPAYLEWLALSAPPFEYAIALDVIGDADASARNWRTMLAAAPTLAPRIVPVWHEGDPVELLDEYAAAASLVALGRIAGRRSEQKTLEFYDAAYNAQPDARFHALGNADPRTLEPYPFASFDSTGWQRDAAYSNASRWPFNRCTKDLRMRAYIEATETIEHKPARQLRLAWGRRDGPAAAGTVRP